MNNEIFDRMIKDNLSGMEMAPSSGLKKALGWKLFFQNMLVFHKIKLIIALALSASVGSYLVFDHFDSNQGEIASISMTQIKASPQAPVALDEETLIVQEHVEQALKNPVGDPKISNEVISSSNGKEDEPSIKEQEVIKGSQDQFVAKDADSNNAADNVQSDKDLYTEQGDQTSNLANNQQSNSDNTDDSKQSTDEEASVLIGDFNETNDQEAEESNDLVSLFRADKLGINIEKAELLSTPVGVELKMPHLIYREWSFDIYKGLMGSSSITSELKSLAHEEYYWDFHGGNDQLKANVLGGINANYTIGSESIRFKGTVGVNFYSVNDQKAHYEFNEITDPAWLQFFNTDELAWVNTMGEDTCTQCFYAHSSEEMKKELKEDYNRYSYLRIPLQLGGQINFKYFSIDLLGGLDYNRLTKSEGLYVKEELNPSYERFYYWDDMQVSTLEEGNEMMKKSFVSWNLAANLRIRVTKNFDLFAGYQMNQSLRSITNDDYLMDKTISSSSASLGITYYPMRTKLAPKF